MAKLVIDGTEINVEDGITLIQACEEAGVEIPRFCYHERLSIAGNCRMCLVEVAGMPKPMASCALGVSDLRPGKDGEPPEIMTNSPLVKKAREGVMEFLLINHPLDCPICDQGGECDLQDQAMAYGIDSSRFALNKRAVEDKNIGPLIKTIMTRCIHCTRCVRFMTEVAGVEELGAIGRGEDMEIVTYLEKGMTSELSGNVIDLCPVGALTSKPYAFTARSWELRKTESIDVMDGVGSNIRVDARGPEVMRIMPRNNDAVNEEWISDKSRFIWDGLKFQRLDRPYLRREGRLETASWSEVLDVVSNRLSQTEPGRIGMIAGGLAAIEELFALKALAENLGVVNLDGRSSDSRLDPASGRASFLFNSTIEGIDSSDVILLVGTNPRYEASVLNARIRERWRTGKLKVGLIGKPVELTYPYEYLGNGFKTLEDLVSGSHSFAKELKNAERGMIILGQGALQGVHGQTGLTLGARLAMDTGLVSERWNGFNVLHTQAADVGALDLGWVPGNDGKSSREIIDAANRGELDLVYLLGADEIEEISNPDTFVIYQGSHGDRGAHMADAVLPGAAYTEKTATYVNIEGRPQMTALSVFPPGEAREDWTIIRALSGHLGQPLPFDNVHELRQLIYAEHPLLAAPDVIEQSEIGDLEVLASRQVVSAGDRSFVCVIDDFYMTNPIARSSKVMAELSRSIRADGSVNQKEATGTDG